MPRSERNFFSDLQFGFKEGVGCIEASFTILETINHIIERRGKVFACYLDVKKAFDTVWIDGQLFKLFFDLGIDGKFWLILKDLHADYIFTLKCYMEAIIPGLSRYYRVLGREEV